jgi:hypothetical protein
MGTRCDGETVGPAEGQQLAATPSVVYVLSVVEVAIEFWKATIQERSGQT